MYQVNYLDAHAQPMTIEHVETLKVLSPFHVTQELLDLQKLKLNHICVDENFILQFSFRNISASKLKIMNCHLKIMVSHLHVSCKPENLI